ncbi:MAG: VOC family protein [Acidimicrobiales bacterium]|nr:VOC family protein [Acidimicrobiales bacterium]
MPERTSYAHGTPNWVDLSTSDVAGAKSFYAAVLGWTLDDRPTDVGVPYTMAIRDGHPIAGMMPMPPDMEANGVPPMWTTYVAVDDIDATTAAAQAAGGQVVMPTMDVMTEGRMALVADPTGAVIGLWQAGDHFGAGLVNEPGTLCWNEVQTSDVPAAAAFYAATFGWGTQTMDMGDQGEYTVFTVGEDGVEGGMNPSMPGIPASWSTVFAVADADATAAAASAAGGSVMVEPFDMPIGRLTVIADPQGAVFQAIALAEPPTE